MTRSSRYLTAALALVVVPASIASEQYTAAPSSSSSSNTQTDDVASDTTSSSSSSSSIAAGSIHTTTTKDHASSSRGNDAASDDFESWEMREDERTGAPIWTRIDPLHEPPSADGAVAAPTIETASIAQVDSHGVQQSAWTESLVASSSSSTDSASTNKDSEELEDSAVDPTSAADDVAIDSHGDSTPLKPVIVPPEPTDAFLTLEERIAVDGFTPALVAQLEALATTHNDPYAHETLAYMTLFEPHGAASTRSIDDAFASLRIAVDAAIAPAASTLALLNRIDYGVPRNASATATERHAAADAVLAFHASRSDLAASLTVAYEHLQLSLAAPVGAPATHACSAAVLHYHKIAESNIRVLADKGDSASAQVVERLSEEWMPRSMFHDDGDGDNAALADAEQRFEYYRTLANDAGDPQFAEAAEHVGRALYYGDAAAGVAQDQAQAAEYFARAADAGDAAAQANLGMMLFNGVGVAQPNNATALRYLRAAAAQDNAFALFGLGVMYRDGVWDVTTNDIVVVQNETRAVLYFEAAAERGYVEAHAYLGAAYLHGQGVDVNGSRAYHHFAIAAETQSPLALFNLAVVQYQGIGTEASCVDAVHNFRAVALHIDALDELLPFSIAKAYACFQQRDFVRAFIHYRLVAEFGDEDAQINAAYLLETYGDAIFAVATSTATATTRLDDNDRTNPQWMGTTKQPLAEAFALYAQASQMNDTEAIRKTALCYYDDWGGVCARNRTRALEQYAIAAELGDSEAAYNCGLMLALGDGVSRDLETAKSYYAQCSEDEFPFNVPCAIALRVLDLALALRPLGQRLQLVLGYQS